MSRARNARDTPSDAPVVNPFERFTQVEFDDYVGGLRNKIRDALDPRRGLRNRDRDSEASFGLGYGEFKMGRSVSVGESSFAASDQGVPRSSMEDDRGELKPQYNEDDDDPQSDLSEPDASTDLALKPTIVVSGEGDSESPFVISDDEDDDELDPTAGDAVTPRRKAHKLLGLKGADEVDYDDEGNDEEEEEEEDQTSSPLRAPLESGPLNFYDDIDDIELVDEDNVENAVGDALDLDDPSDERGDTFERSSPPWPEHAGADGDVGDEGHLQESANTLDEYFVADMDHLPPGFSSTEFGYDPSEPEMREYSGHTNDPFSQMLDPGIVAGPSFPHERSPQIFPTHDSNTLTWPTNDFPAGAVGGIPGFTSGDVLSTEGTSQGSTLREESQGISYPHLPAFSEGGNVNVFDSFIYPPQMLNPVEPALTPVASQLHNPGDVTPTVHENLIPAARPDNTYNELPLPVQGVAHPDTIEEPRDDTVPQYSEDIGSLITPSLTPPLSPSGITLTAPDPSLLSDNSSVATSIPVALEPTGHPGRQIDSVEFDHGIEDLTLPEEVTQELNQDVSLLPDPHRVPEPTSLGTPDGVAGLATRIVEPSVWAEPPTPSRSEDADEVPNIPEDENSRDRSEELPSPPQPGLVIESQPANSRNLARVRWRDHHTGDLSSIETPAEELNVLERALVQPTALEQPAEPPQEGPSSLEHALALPTPIQTLLETRQEPDGLPHAPTPPTSTGAPIETPREELNTLEQSLLTGGSAGSTPLTMRGNLTRESTMTDATWSQGPVAGSPLRHATSATLTGESYFPSQPIVSPSQRTPSEEGEAQNTLDNLRASPMKHTAEVDHSVAHSASPFSDDSPLSEDDQEPSNSKATKTRKRASNLSRLSSSVGVIGKRELKSLQAGAAQLDSGRPRRQPSSKLIIQTTKASARSKGKQKASPATRKEPPTLATSTRLRALRSNSLASPTVSKQSSPTSTAGHEGDSNESSRDELDLLKEADEEEREREDEDAGSEQGEGHYKKKRKRYPRVTMPGDDEDYLPEGAERSIKRRKLEAKEHDLDQSLDTIDLASVLEMAEGKPSVDVQKGEKSRNPKKKRKAILKEPLEAQSSSGEASDKGSEFKLSPDAEAATGGLNEAVELDTEAFHRLSPAAQARFRKLNPDSRAYKPPRELDSESEDDVKVSRADLIADLKGIVEGLDEPTTTGDREGDLEPAVPLESEDPSTIPKKKEKRKRSGAKISKKTDAAVGDNGTVLSPEKSSEPRTEGEQGRGVDVEMELGGDVTSIEEKEPASMPMIQQPAQKANERYSWAGYNPFRNLFRSTNEEVEATIAGNISPLTDPMEVD